MASWLASISLASLLFQLICGFGLESGNPFVQLASPFFTFPMKMTQMATGSSNNPLVEAFASSIIDKFAANPFQSGIFSMANLPGIEAGKFFKNVMFKNLMSKGSPKMTEISDSSSNAVASTFDSLNPMKLIKTMAFTYGTDLFKKGFLNKDNFSLLADNFFEDFMSCFKNMKDSGIEGCIQVLIDACEKFYSRFGLKWTDVIEDLSALWVGQLTKCAVGV